MNNLHEFIEDELLPVLFAHADDCFPEMDFIKVRSTWYSRRFLDGSGDDSIKGRKDRTVFKDGKPGLYENGSGNYEDAFDRYMRNNGFNPSIPSDAWKAAKKLADDYNVPMPDEGTYDNEEYKVFKEKEARLYSALSKMKKDLRSEVGKESLDYLYERGCSDAFIEYAEIGFCSAETIGSIKDLFTYIDKSGNTHTPFFGIGRSHVIAIPYYSKSSVRGFLFRRLGDGKPKYVDAFLTAKDTKNYHLFGLKTKYKGSRRKGKNITVVEGELDALRASFFGVENVVAASGGNLSIEALQEAKKQGVEEVTVLFDADIVKTDTEAIQRDIKDRKGKIERAFANIKQVGLHPFLATFPQPNPSEKVDADSFLTHIQTQRGEDAAREAFEDIVKRAHSELYCRYEILREEIGKENYQRDIARFERSLFNILSEATESERKEVYADLKNIAGEDGNPLITPESLEERVLKDKAIRETQRQSSEALKLSADAYALIRDGKTDEGLRLMMDKAPMLARISKTAAYDKMLSLPSREQIKESFRRKSEGIALPYVFGQGDRQEQLVLPSGALTYICAPTSHGKSRMAQNITVETVSELIRKDEDGGVLYLTLEEDVAATELELLNIYQHQTLSKNNLRSLSSYYSTGDIKFFSGSQIEKKIKKEALAKAENEFFDLLTSGRIRVIHYDMDVEYLTGLIRHAKETADIKVVLVDYVQLLSTTTPKGSRKAELKDISQALVRTAIETGLPIVLCAQLNRQAFSPVDMKVQNIADASEIEHGANIVILLWNSVESPLPGNTWYSTGKSWLPPKKKILEICKRNGWDGDFMYEEFLKIAKSDLSSDAFRLTDRLDFHIGQSGQLYALLAKNRGGIKNLDTVLEFDGNTGYITPNYKEPTPEERQGPKEISFNKTDECPF